MNRVRRSRLRRQARALSRAGMTDHQIARQLRIHEGAVQGFLDQIRRPLSDGRHPPGGGGTS